MSMQSRYFQNAGQNQPSPSLTAVSRVGAVGVYADGSLVFLPAHFIMQRYCVLKAALSLSPASRAKLSMINTMSKIRGQEKGPGYPQAEALLAEAMLKFGRELGDDCNFGKQLLSYGRYPRRFQWWLKKQNRTANKTTTKTKTPPPPRMTNSRGHESASLYFNSQLQMLYMGDEM